MGCYNTIILDCPNCGESLHIQTKSGSCSFKYYDIKSVPMADLKSLVNEDVLCSECNYLIEFEGLEDFFRIDASRFIK